jgi:putative transposase
MDVFFNTEDRRAYLAHLQKACRGHGVDILAWCLMDNHVHLVAVPRKEDSLARCFSEAHGKYTRRVNKREGWTGHLWQGRFGSSVLDEPHTIAAVRYVERNPVRAGMARIPWTYQWSSARWHTGREQADPLISNDDQLKHLIQDWERYLLSDDEERFIQLIRKGSSVNRPLGGNHFVWKLERRFKRSLIRRNRVGGASEASISE